MLGTKIKKYLDSNGIKYTHVSETTGIPMNVLSPMLNEKREIKAREYFIICDALNVPLTQFSGTESA
mgnify:CR=1 FL=1